MFQVRKILYATDFSSYSNQAYFHAVALAENHRASLTIVFVFTPGMEAIIPRGKHERTFWREQLEQIHPSNPAIRVNHVFLDGDPASEIVRYTQDAHIDLVVMGTHGRTGVERMVLGSVAERVLQDAPCSVLVVKLPRATPVGEPADVELIASR